HASRRSDRPPTTPGPPRAPRPAWRGRRHRAQRSVAVRRQECALTSRPWRGLEHPYRTACHIRERCSCNLGTPCSSVEVDREHCSLSEKGKSRSEERRVGKGGSVRRNAEQDV